MANYELLYTLPAKYTEAEIADLKGKITAELTKLGLSISRNDEIGKIKLAYPMKHVRYGHYMLVMFTAEPTAITKVNEFMRLHSEVLRHQVVKPDADAKLFAMLADPEVRLERRTDAVPAGVAAQVMPTSEPIAKGPAITEEELDKKLTAIEEDITKSL
jgi:small subunit ribosomal protein S6